MGYFVDAKHPEVIARVAYHLVRIAYVKHGLTPADGPLCVGYARDDLPGDGMDLLDTALLALQFHVIRGGRARAWRDKAVLLSRYGYGFRRCWYDDYKANRRR